MYIDWASRLFSSYYLLNPLLYFLFIFYLPQRIMYNFPSIFIPGLFAIFILSSFLNRTTTVKYLLTVWPMSWWTIGSKCSKSRDGKTIPVFPSHDPSLIFPFHLLPFPAHHALFSFRFIPGLLTTLSCCHQTTATKSFWQFGLLVHCTDGCRANAMLVSWSTVYIMMDDRI